MSSSSEQPTLHDDELAQQPENKADLAREIENTYRGMPIFEAFRLAKFETIEAAIDFAKTYSTNPSVIEDIRTVPLIDGGEEYVQNFIAAYLQSFHMHDLSKQLMTELENKIIYATPSAPRTPDSEYLQAELKGQFFALGDSGSLRENNVRALIAVAEGNGIRIHQDRCFQRVLSLIPISILRNLAPKILAELKRTSLAIPSELTHSKIDYLVLKIPELKKYLDIENSIYQQKLSQSEEGEYLESRSIQLSERSPHDDISLRLPLSFDQFNPTGRKIDLVENFVQASKLENLKPNELSDFIKLLLKDGVISSDFSSTIITYINERAKSSDDVFLDFFEDDDFKPKMFEALKNSILSYVQNGSDHEHGVKIITILTQTRSREIIKNSHLFEAGDYEEQINYYRKIYLIAQMEQKTGASPQFHENLVFATNCAKSLSSQNAFLRIMQYLEPALSEQSQAIFQRYQKPTRMQEFKAQLESILPQGSQNPFDYMKDLSAKLSYDDHSIATYSSLLQAGSLKSSELLELYLIELFNNNGTERLTEYQRKLSIKQEEAERKTADLRRVREEKIAKESLPAQADSKITQTLPISEGLETRVAKVTQPEKFHAPTAAELFPEDDHRILQDLRILESDVTKTLEHRLRLLKYSELSNLNRNLQETRSKEGLTMIMSEICNDSEMAALQQYMQNQNLSQEAFEKFSEKLLSLVSQQEKEIKEELHINQRRLLQQRAIEAKDKIAKSYSAYRFRKKVDNYSLLVKKFTTKLQELGVELHSFHAQDLDQLLTKFDSVEIRNEKSLKAFYDAVSDFCSKNSVELGKFETFKPGAASSPDEIITRTRNNILLAAFDGEIQAIRSRPLITETKQESAVVKEIIKAAAPQNQRGEIFKKILDFLRSILKILVKIASSSINKIRENSAKQTLVAR
jgi:hypothetical protein